MEFVVMLVLLIFLAVIPANIAQGKGYSFWGYYFFGLCFFLPALVVALVIPDKTNGEKKPSAVSSSTKKAPMGTADEIAKYKKLLDEGAITDTEFVNIKKQLLGSGIVASPPKTSPNYKHVPVTYEVDGEDGLTHECFECPECGDTWMLELGSADTRIAQCGNEACGCKVYLDR